MAVPDSGEYRGGVLAADAAVVEPQTDGSILAKVEGHRDGIVVGATPG